MKAWRMEDRAEKTDTGFSIRRISKEQIFKESFKKMRPQSGRPFDSHTFTAIEGVEGPRLLEQAQEFLQQAQKVKMDPNFVKQRLAEMVATMN